MFASPERPVSTAELIDLKSALTRFDQNLDDAARIDRIRALEDLRGAVAAAQARETAAFVASQRQAAAAAGVPTARAGRGVAAQVALARRISPFYAQRDVGWSQILTTELPGAFAQLQAGQVSEWRAMLVARETAWLSREHRLAVDAELAPQLQRLGDRQTEAQTRRLAYRLDPRGYIARIRGAVGDRHVSIRPAPDAMARLTTLVPVAQGVATYAALTAEADRARAHGDPRSRGQVMADTLVQRVTGQATATDVPIEINLVMTDQTLLNAGPGRDEPADVPGYGPIPAPIARDLINQPGDAVPRWIRRLYTGNKPGQLAAMESRRRTFTPSQRRFVRLRDGGICRTPWCGAPIRHTDHARPAEDGGPTDVANGQGLCEACNYAKQAEGWRTVVIDDDAQITTPTSHTYRSRAPDLPEVA